MCKESYINVYNFFKRLENFGVHNFMKTYSTFEIFTDFLQRCCNL